MSVVCKNIPLGTRFYDILDNLVPMVEQDQLIGHNCSSSNSNYFELANDNRYMAAMDSFVRDQKLSMLGRGVEVILTDDKTFKVPSFPR